MSNPDTCVLCDCCSNCSKKCTECFGREKVETVFDEIKRVLNIVDCDSILKASEYVNEQIKSEREEIPTDDSEESEGSDDCDEDTSENETASEQSTD
jgi:hypothetical protein